MHVVMFGDQHVESLGGAQVSMRLQREFLERAGHTVTIVAPALHGRRAAAVAPDDAYVDVPSIPITFDREYSLSWPGGRTDRWVDDALAARPRDCAIEGGEHGGRQLLRCRCTTGFQRFG